MACRKVAPLHHLAVPVGPLGAAVPRSLLPQCAADLLGAQGSLLISSSHLIAAARRAAPVPASSDAAMHCGPQLVVLSLPAAPQRPRTSMWQVWWWWVQWPGPCVLPNAGRFSLWECFRQHRRERTGDRVFLTQDRQSMPLEKMGGFTRIIL